MKNAKDVYQSQIDLQHAEEKLNELREDLYYQATKGPSLMDPFHASENHPEVVARKKAIEDRKVALKADQEALGGKVYRVPAENVSTFAKKVGKINRKAEKLGCDLVNIESKETEEEVRKSQGQETLYIWHYMTLKGSTPMVPGYRFIAALDHTVQAKEGDPVIIKRVPGTDEDIDLSGYRTANAQCDHCRQLRARNTTYILKEDASGEFFKVGSTCLRDFTGANDPEKIASYMEYLIEFDEQSTQMGEDYESFGRSAPREVSEYLTHVAACIRHEGWSPRSMGAATADSAWNNIYNYGKKGHRGQNLYVEITDEDRQTALKALAWANTLQGGNEFEENLIVMAGLKYMPVKGDGIVAYIVQGYVKDETKRIEREAEEARMAEMRKNSEPIKEGRYTIEGMVINAYERETDWGMQYKMTVLDDRGFKVNGSIPRGLVCDKGDRVRLDATVKPKDGETDYGWYKRPTKAELIERAEV